MGKDDGEISGNGARDVAASLTVGPTSEGMVRILVEGEGVDVPMDFDPDEAEEIADELRAAAARARVTAGRKAPARRDERRRR